MKLGDKIKTNYFGKTVEGVVTEMTTTNFTLTDDKGTKYCISASEFKPKYKAIEVPFKELVDMYWSKAPKTESNEDWRDSLNKFKNLIEK